MLLCADGRVEGHELQETGMFCTDGFIADTPDSQVVIIRGSQYCISKQQRLTITLDSGAFEAEPRIFMPPWALKECDTFSI